jgi:hypothetical protein
MLDDLEPDVAQNQIQVLQQQYTEVCKSYHAIADFRATLLALWPVLGVAGGAVAAGAGLDRIPLIGVAALGLVASVGIALYEWTQSLRCMELIRIARRLEKKMLGRDSGLGQFRSVRVSYGFRLKPTDGDYLRHGLAGVVIYVAVVLGWSLLLVAALAGVTLGTRSG